jgi:hypothetical protein
LKDNSSEEKIHESATAMRIGRGDLDDDADELEGSLY